MQRLFGFLLVFTGCSGMGVWYSMQFRLRIQNMKQMCYILKLFTGQVRYGKSPLPICCQQIADKAEEPFRRCFLEIYEAMKGNQGRDFGQVCRECFDRNLKNQAITSMDRERFINSFIKTGFEEGKTMLQNIEQELNELQDSLNGLIHTQSSRCRMAVSLGTMGGLLLGILFL